MAEIVSSVPEQDAERQHESPPKRSVFRNPNTETYSGNGLYWRTAQAVNMPNGDIIGVDGKATDKCRNERQKTVFLIEVARILCDQAAILRDQSTRLFGESKQAVKKRPRLP